MIIEGVGSQKSGEIIPRDGKSACRMLGKAIGCDRKGFQSGIPGEVIDGSGAKGRITVSVVAMSHGLDKRELLLPSRGSAERSHARQLAMYLMHTVFSCGPTEVGRFFGRHRSTIAYACSQIEDKRDEPAFDRQLQRLEALLTDIRELSEIRQEAR